MQSYQHHTQAQGHKMKYLMYNQEKHKPDELVKDIIYTKLQKHFFYFQIDIVDDGRDINELVDFIGGACASPSTKPKKKRKKSKPIPARPKTLALQKTASMDIPGSSQQTPNETPSGTPAETPTEISMKTDLNNEKDDDNKELEPGWREFIDRKSCRGNAVFTVSREYDFDITEEDESGTRGMTLEKAEYLDRLSGIIASKAQAEWENKKVGFEKLQREQEQIENEIKGKEALFR